MESLAAKVLCDQMIYEVEVPLVPGIDVDTWIAELAPEQGV